MLFNAYPTVLSSNVGLVGNKRHMKLYKTMYFTCHALEIEAYSCVTLTSRRIQNPLSIHL